MCRIAKNIVYTVFGIAHAFRHPLGGYGTHPLWIRGDYFNMLQKAAILTCSSLIPQSNFHMIFTLKEKERDTISQFPKIPRVWMPFTHMPHHFILWPSLLLDAKFLFEVSKFYSSVLFMVESWHIFIQLTYAANARKVSRV